MRTSKMVVQMFTELIERNADISTQLARIESKLEVLMATTNTTAELMNQQLDDINNSTNLVAAQLDELKALVINGGMNAEAEAAVLTRLTQSADALRAIAAPAPPVEEPLPAAPEGEPNGGTVPSV